MNSLHLTAVTPSIIVSEVKPEDIASIFALQQSNAKIKLKKDEAFLESIRRSSESALIVAKNTENDVLGYAFGVSLAVLQTIEVGQKYLPALQAENVPKNTVFLQTMVHNNARGQGISKLLEEKRVAILQSIQCPAMVSFSAINNPAVGKINQKRAEIYASVQKIVPIGKDMQEKAMNLFYL